MTTGSQNEKSANDTATKSIPDIRIEATEEVGQSLTGPSAKSDFRPRVSVLQPLLGGEAYCFALWEEGPGAPRQGLTWKRSTHAWVGGGITRAGICTSKTFGPGHVEVGHVLQQTQLASKVGSEEAISNDSNNA